MKRWTHVFLGCLILVKITVVVLVFSQRDGSVFLFENRAMAFDDGQGEGRPLHGEIVLPESSASELKAVLAIKKEIEIEKESMRRERGELEAIQEEIAAKIVELSRLRDDIRAQMETKKFVEEQRVKHLVKAYSTMKPQIAAGLVEKLELPFAIEMLSRMPGDTVGSILSFVNKERGAKISQGLVKPR
jgi:flagellar motility protein MotE (MotC chaperone)